MNQRLCGFLVGVTWAGGLLYSVIQIKLQLPFCWPNASYCYMFDLFPLLKLAYTDTHIFVNDNSAFIWILTFYLLLDSHNVILFSPRAHSSEGQYNVISTYGSFSTVVLLFFVPSVIYGLPISSLTFEKACLYMLLSWNHFSILLFTLSGIRKWRMPLGK